MADKDPTVFLAHRDIGHAADNVASHTDIDVIELQSGRRQVLKSITKRIDLKKV